MNPEIDGRPQTDFRERAIARMNSFCELSEDEKHDLGDLAAPPVTFGRNAAIRAEEDSPTCLYLLLDGWAASSITLDTGSRQLIALNLPGDLIGLPSLAIAEPIDAMIALSDVTVCEVPVERFFDLLARRPRIASILFLISQEERMLALERLALAGKAPARARLAAFFVRLQERLEQFGQSMPDRFTMPLTQQEIGDLVGVSAVHVNAIYKEFRESGILTLKQREMHILDQQRLIETAGIARWRRSEPTWLPPRRTDERGPG